VAPIAAIVFLVITIGKWSNITYALEVRYDGKVLGYVTNEQIISDGVQMAEQQILQYAEASGEEALKKYEIDFPEYEMAVVSAQTYHLNANSICNAIISSVNTVVEDAAGLYIDGQLFAVSKSRLDLEYMLQIMLDEYSDPNDKTMTAAFVQNVEIVEGLYSSVLVRKSDEVWELLNSKESTEQIYTVKAGDAPISIANRVGLTLSQLQALNPNRDLVKGTLRVGDKLVIAKEQGVLTIRQIRYETYTKQIAYSTETKKTTALYVGETKVIVKGKNGVTSYTDIVTYIDGVEVERENVSSKVVSRPKTQVVQVGTTPRPTIKPPSQQAIAGKYLWPVPSKKTISKSFAYYDGSLHKAIDIPAGKGSSVISAASGTVISSGWHYGYGYNMTIQHADGTQAFYAHCQKLLVSKGDRVVQGQQIATVGSTGSWSTGPHLHFSFIVDGTYVNPINYLTK
jgi:murein DD-endopeptidase MepM/ murein hydrolase activator NlpD